MPATISRLLLYPVKGCRGIALSAVLLAPTGLAVGEVGDREWVIVDDHDEFLSQRELPKMALIETRLVSGALRLSAPGMPSLDIPFESEGDIVRIRVWNDELGAVTQGDLADRWFSDFLGRRARLMRFDPLARRTFPHRPFWTLVIVALLPHLFFGIYNAGYQSHLASGLSLAPLAVVLRGLWIVMPLVLVTYADINAVNPRAMTPWHAQAPISSCWRITSTTRSKPCCCNCCAVAAWRAQVPWQKKTSACCARCWSFPAACWNTTRSNTSWPG